MLKSSCSARGSTSMNSTSVGQLTHSELQLQGSVELLARQGTHDIHGSKGFVLFCFVLSWVMMTHIINPST